MALSSFFEVASVTMYLQTLVALQSKLDSIPQSDLIHPENWNNMLFLGLLNLCHFDSFCLRKCENIEKQLTRLPTGELTKQKVVFTSIALFSSFEAHFIMYCAAVIIIHPNNKIKQRFQTEICPLRVVIIHHQGCW